VIPEDWEIKSLGDIARIQRGASPRPIDSPIWFDENASIGWVRISDVTRSRLTLKETAQALSFKGVSKSRFVKRGSLIMSICATVWHPIITGIDVCIHDGFVVFNDPISSLVYLFYTLKNIENGWSKAGQTGSQMNLNTGIINPKKIPLPPLPEQDAIATALSDVDTLITKLDQLIAKKRDIKQATMQQLLTGQTRLPGFRGEWEVKRLGTTATLKARIGWQGLTTAEYLNTGDYYLVTGTDFKGGYIDWNNCHYVDESRYKQDRYIQLTKYDVLVTKDGTIGKVALVNDLYIPATLNSGVFVIRPIDGAFNPEFFYYLLCSKLFTEFLTQLSAGSTINHLYQKDFVDFRYKTPPTLSEQTAIATILSDMDAEITALESRRKKTRALKQGMMQELLTGRIRLPIAKHHMVSDRTNPTMEMRQ